MVRSELVSHPKHTADTMLAALHADGAHPDHAAELSLFGQFVGSWAIDNTYFHESGRERHEAEWRFGWTPDRRAAPDALFPPPPSKTNATRASSEGIGTRGRPFPPPAAARGVVFFCATRREAGGPRRGPP